MQFKEGGEHDSGTIDKKKTKYYIIYKNVVVTRHNYGAVTMKSNKGIAIFP